MEQVMRRPNSASPPILPDELIREIFSSLPVKPLVRFRCVNKNFKTLISDSYFVQMHLNKSSRNSQLAITDCDDSDFSLVTLSIPQLAPIRHSGPCYPFDDEYWKFVGSCNGLLCLIAFSYSPSQHQCLCFWNPATRTQSQYFKVFPDFSLRKSSFGYDVSTQTYKVVAFNVDDVNRKSVVKVFSLGDNSWRNIQCFPVLPLYCCNDDKNNGVHLNGTINWLAFRDVTVDRYVILSLDLSTETYTQLLLPRRFDNFLNYQPKIVVLMGCLCFCHTFEGNHLVIWQMKDFGVQDSWIQLFKISYENCFGWVDLLPLYLSKNGDTHTLILANNANDTFIYNCRDNKIEKIGITNRLMWSQAKDYVESLVSPH